MPKRLLRDGILESRAVNALSEPAELLYRRLMSIVDDYGRFESDPDLIRARAFPLQLDRWPPDRVARVFTELHGGSPLVTVYQIAGKGYFQIENFGQRIQAKSKYPNPPWKTVDHGGSLCINENSCTENKGEPFSTVDHGGSPPRASRAQTKSNAQSESESESESNAQPHRIASVGLEFPQIAVAVRSDFPATDDVFIVQLAQAVFQKVLSANGTVKCEPDDAMIADAVKECHTKKQTSAGLYLKTVPQCVLTWVTQGRAGKNAPYVPPPDFIEQSKREREQRRKELGHVG